MSEYPSIDLLASRLEGLPAQLALALRTSLPGRPPQWAKLAAMRRFVVTGGGLSEGPARVLVARLQRAGREARFEPQSAFLVERDCGAGSAVILFSQGLAPNARLPLPAMISSEAALLVTSVVADHAMSKHVRSLVAAGHLVWTLPPEREDGLLLRVVGPAIALLAALRIAEALTGASASRPNVFASLPDLAQRVLAAPGPDLFGGARRPIAIVTEPSLLELAMPLRWKLLEGLRVPDPPVWDPLQVAHGPLQSFYEHPLTILMLRTASGEHDESFARLEQVLRADRHHVVELRASPASASMDIPLALLELDAALNAALLATLQAHPIALDDWPARGLDGPLYDVTAVRCDDR